MTEGRKEAQAARLRVARVEPDANRSNPLQEILTPHWFHSRPPLSANDPAHLPAGQGAVDIVEPSSPQVRCSSSFGVRAHWLTTGEALEAGGVDQTPQGHQRQ